MSRIKTKYIEDNAVTNPKLAQVSTQTFKGRTTAGTGNPEDLTATQATAILNNFVGDSGSGGTKGLVPAPAAGDAAASKFLKADGTWATTSGSGTVTSVALTVPAFLSVSGSPITTSGTLAVAFSGTALPVANGGTGQTSLAAHGVLIGNGTSGISVTAAGSAGQVLQSGGASADPTYSTATYPSTTTVNRILYSSATNTISEIASAATSALVTNSSSVPSFTSGTTANRLLRTNGTTISFAQADLTTDVTGTLPVGSGGTGQTTLTIHGVLLGNTTSGINATAAGSAGQILQSGGASADPTYSTATYPSTTTANQILYSSAANTVGQITTAATSALVTNSSSVPAFTSGSTANRVLRTNGTTISFAQVDMTTDVTGVLPTGNGGTGRTTLSFPNATDTVAILAGTQTFSNKSLEAATTKIVDATDPTKKIGFDVSGNTTAKTLTLLSSVTVDRTITFPDATDQLVGRATTDTLTNKTIKYDVTSHNANFTLSATNSDYAPIDASGGSVTVTLPTAVGANGKTYQIKKTDSTTNTVVINTTSSQTIDGLASFTLRRQYNSLTVVSNNANWLIVARDVEDFLSASSSTKTPTASGNYQSFTGNSITLTPGSWILYGQIDANSSGGDPVYTNLTGQWGTANGADTSSTPTAASLDAGVGGCDNFWLKSLNSGGNNWPIDINMPEARITVAAGATQSVFLNVLAAMTTAANARLKVQLWASRIR